jgi:hypothetical protein
MMANLCISDAHLLVLVFQGNEKEQKEPHYSETCSKSNRLYLTFFTLVQQAIPIWCTYLAGQFCPPTQYIQNND